MGKVKLKNLKFVCNLKGYEYHSYESSNRSVLMYRKRLGKTKLEKIRVIDFINKIQLHFLAE